MRRTEGSVRIKGDGARASRYACATIVNIVLGNEPKAANTPARTHSNRYAAGDEGVAKGKSTSQQNATGMRDADTKQAERTAHTL
jgi:hypothetical protein